MGTRAGAEIACYRGQYTLAMLQYESQIPCVATPRPRDIPVLISLNLPIRS